MSWSCVALSSLVALLCLGSSSYWHLLPFRKLLTLQGEKETWEWVLDKAWDGEEGALSSLWENKLVFLRFLFVACLCGEPEGDEPNDGSVKKEHKLRSLNFSLCSWAWIILMLGFVLFSKGQNLQKTDGWGGWKKHNMKMLDVSRWLGI